MKARSLFGVASILTTLALAGCATDTEADTESAEGAATQARPPQFVILAFDGSSSLPFWNESRAFAKENKVKFTYFISGVYFVPDAAKREYLAPKNGAGRSAIGFGSDVATINQRFRQVQLAHDEGNEIASHANGHFDGTSWSQADWKSEFDQFDKLIFQGVGGVRPGLTFNPLDSVGFRAPQLGHRTEMLYPVMAAHNYEYDTSKSAAANYWPQQISGVWNFPLAQLRIVGSGKRTLSMDYNFYVADSGGTANSANKETYKRQMIDTYQAYFEGNYFGNRAPVHIGHHFSKWNGGAYWEAMQTFAKRVCGLPEVKCGTYKELLAFVKENRSKIADYQAGSFPKMARPPASKPTVFDPFSQEELDEVLQNSHENHEDEAE